MIATVLLAALALPDSVGAPPPGDFTLMLGYERRAMGEARAGLTRWLGLTVTSELGKDPRITGALRLAAADGRRKGLFAHTEFTGGVRPRFDTDVVSSFDLGLAVGLLGRWGPAFLRFDGGVALGFAPSPVPDLDRSFDQQGGLFVTQRLVIGVDFAQRFRVDGYLWVAVPSSSFLAESPEDEALRATDATFGARLGVRF